MRTISRFGQAVALLSVGAEAACGQHATTMGVGRVAPATADSSVARVTTPTAPTPSRGRFWVSLSVAAGTGTVGYATGYYAGIRMRCSRRWSACPDDSAVLLSAIGASLGAAVGAHLGGIRGDSRGQRDILVLVAAVSTLPALIPGAPGAANVTLAVAPILTALADHYARTSR